VVLSTEIVVNSVDKVNYPLSGWTGLKDSVPRSPGPHVLSRTDHWCLVPPGEDPGTRTDMFPILRHLQSCSSTVLSSLHRSSYLLPETGSYLLACALYVLCADLPSALAQTLLAALVLASDHLDDISHLDNAPASALAQMTAAQ
jgi:hypothetical protein